MCSALASSSAAPVKSMALRRCLRNPRLSPSALPFSLNLVVLILCERLLPCICPLPAVLVSHPLVLWSFPACALSNTRRPPLNPNLPPPTPRTPSLSRRLPLSKAPKPTSGKSSAPSSPSRTRPASWNWPPSWSGRASSSSPPAGRPRPSATPACPLRT